MDGPGARETTSLLGMGWSGGQWVFNLSQNRKIQKSTFPQNRGIRLRLKIYYFQLVHYIQHGKFL